MAARTFAFLGKGGVGKTILSALTGRIFSEKGMRVLYVDADPALGLTIALEIEAIKTIGEARVEIIEKARIAGSEEEKARMADIIDYLLMEAVYEMPDYSIISMGQTDRLGCYCPLNSLLRSTIGAIATNYDVVIIDAEAGIEQVNRQVVETVDLPVIVTDNSMRGVKTAVMIHEVIKKIPSMKEARTGVIFNRVEMASEKLVTDLEKAGLPCYGHIPPDRVISLHDIEGKSLFTMRNSDDGSRPKSLESLEIILHNSKLIT